MTLTFQELLFRRLPGLQEEPSAMFLLLGRGEGAGAGGTLWETSVLPHPLEEEVTAFLSCSFFPPSP